MLRRYSETAAVVTSEPEARQLGWHLVEAASGKELMQVIAIEESLCLTSDGRGFPQERAHYVFAIVQLVEKQDRTSPDGITHEQPAQEGEINDGDTPDQTG